MPDRLARLVAVLRSFGRSTAGDRGATATEYAILVGFIAVVIVAGITFFGSALSTWYQQLASQLGL